MATNFELKLYKKITLPFFVLFCFNSLRMKKKKKILFKV